LARTIELTCDVCKKPTKRIVGKLHFIPMIPGVNRSAHSNYTHHLDVGDCCKARLLKGFNFRPRLSSAEYQEKRKNGAA
jgi:hypothetical protein